MKDASRGSIPGLFIQVKGRWFKAKTVGGTMYFTEVCDRVDAEEGATEVEVASHMVAAVEHLQHVDDVRASENGSQETVLQAEETMDSEETPNFQQKFPDFFPLCSLTKNLQQEYQEIQQENSCEEIDHYGCPDAAQKDEDEEVHEVTLIGPSFEDPDIGFARLNVEKGYWRDINRVKTICQGNDLRSVLRQHYILNKWYYIPHKAYRTEYPFPCCGFVLPRNDGSKIIRILTQRFGWIERKDDKKRKGKPFAYFLVTGEGEYKAWEWDEIPPSIVSYHHDEKFLFCTGYAIMAPASNQVFAGHLELKWNAWNDFTGYMVCEKFSSRAIRWALGDSWRPYGQFVKFEAFSSNGLWQISRLLPLDDTRINLQRHLPRELFFIDDVRLLPKNLQNGYRILFQSKSVDADCIHALSEHAWLKGDVVYGALVYVSWRKNREVHALAVAPIQFWHESYSSDFYDLGRELKLHSWYKAHRKPQKRLYHPTEEETRCKVY